MGRTGYNSMFKLQDIDKNDRIWLFGDPGYSIIDNDLYVGPALASGVRTFRFYGRVPLITQFFQHQSNLSQKNNW